jgi:hypothetical protein
MCKKLSIRAEDNFTSANRKSDGHRDDDRRASQRLSLPISATQNRLI